MLKDYNEGSINCNSRCRQTWSNTYVQEAPAARSTEAPGAWARAHERPAGGAMAAVPRILPLNTTHTQSSASTWDRESKTLIDTHNCMVQ